MIDFLNSPIFITGIERSGTSIIARIISHCGAHAGTTSEMQEHLKIKEIVNLYYDMIYIPLQGQYPLPDTKELLIPVDWKNRIIKEICSDRYNGEDKAWMYKGNRICQIWPIWNYAFPNAKYIIVRRRSKDIVSSCMKTAYMSAFKDKANQRVIGVNTEQDGWIWWIHEHEKRFVEMIQAGLNCKVVWPERMVNGDYSQIIEMLEWLGLKWDDSIIKMIKPLLLNSQQKERSK